MRLADIVAHGGTIEQAADCRPSTESVHNYVLLGRHILFGKTHAIQRMVHYNRAFMTADRWSQIEAVCGAALDLPLHERNPFIAAACNGDSDLLREVEDLVRRADSPSPVLPDTPVWNRNDQPGSQPVPGSRLGPYEIGGPVGAGGMGVVFRAIDTRLGRDVAIKIAHSPFSDRFAREARAIAALNHPNICTLYDTGPDYLVMEFIEGPTLADRLRKGPIPLDEALRIARQIAGAIEAAHDRGIIHRDLKPANIKIRPDGSVKVLDFGLAKSTRQADSTRTSAELRLGGLVAGTAAYMSPEQARNQEVDKRCDVWAFGVMLYEMLAGARPFDGPTVSDCIAGIVSKEPDLTRVPQSVRRLISLCLEKDPAKRLRSLGDWERFIGEPAAAPRKARSFRGLALVAVALVLAAAAFAIWSRLSTPAHAVRFEIPSPDNVQFDEYLAVSPDGRKLVVKATGNQTSLWIRDLDRLEWRPLPGTERANAPFWSPDSRFVGFAAGKQLKKINVAAGLPQTIAAIESPATVSAWNNDGVIVFGGKGDGGLHRVADTGGLVTALTHPEGPERPDSFPSFLPDQKHFLYLAWGDPERQGVYVGSIDDGPATQPKERLLANSSSASYVDGNILFVRNGALMMQRFDPSRLALQGDPVRVADNVAAVHHYSVFSAIPGALAYRTGSSAGDEMMNWYDREGKAVGTVPPPNLYPRLSPQGTRAVVSGSDGNLGEDYWTLNFATGAISRLTFPPSGGVIHTTSASALLCGGCPGVWSPDGTSVFFPGGKEQDTILEKAADGSGAERAWLTQPGASFGLEDVSPDGRFVIYLERRKGLSSELKVLTLDASRRQTRLFDGSAPTSHGRLSPDGRWFTYATIESGHNDLYVRPFISSGPNAPALGPGRWQISHEGTASAARWRADGRELYYLDADGFVQAVEVDGRRPAFQVGASRPLFRAPCFCGFDVTPDGERFLLRSLPGGKAPITVVLNWQSELSAR